MPGQTRAIHFIQLNKLTIVDLPGYGYSMKENKVEQWKNFTDTYLKDRTKLKRVCILIDSRHGLKQSDYEYLDFLEANKKKFQIILTKVDLVEPEDLARRYNTIKEELANRRYRRALDRIMMVSSLTKAGVPLLKKELASLAYAGPQLMERQEQLRIGEPTPPRIGFGINSQLKQKQIFGARGRIALPTKGRQGRPRR